MGAEGGEGRQKKKKQVPVKGVVSVPLAPPPKQKKSGRK
jgi:hypothetical protein